MRPLLSSDLGGEADSVTFFGLVRVVGGCLLMVETSEWSVTGSSSGMAGSGGNCATIGKAPRGGDGNLK